MPLSVEDGKRLIEVEAQLRRLEQGGGRAAPSTDWTHQRTEDAINAEEAKYPNIPRGLSKAVAYQESAYNPDARGDGGQAQGFFQLHKGAAIDAGIDPARRGEPDLNIPGGVKYLSMVIDRAKGDIPTALSLYNRGTPDYRGIGDPNYIQNVARHYKPEGEKPSWLARLGRALGPSSAEAATPQAQGGSRLEALEAEIARREAIEAEIARREAQQTPQAMTPPPTARSTPEQDAAHRASRGQKEGAQAETPAAPNVAPGGRQGPATPALERFTRLRSTQEAAPAVRQRRQEEFLGLPPALQEEYLRGEEATQPAEASSDLTVPIEKVSPSAPRSEADRLARVREELAAWEQQAGRPWREGDPRMPSEKRLGVPDEAPVEESLTAPSTMIPLLMPGAGAKAVLPLLAKAPAAVGRLVRPLAEGVSQTLGYGTGRSVETGEVPSAGDLGTTLGVTTALGGALELAAPIAARVGNTLRGVVKPAYQSIVDTAEKYGIRLSYGDVTRGSVAPKVETVLEAIPGSGAGRMRVGQQADVTRAGEALRGGLQTEMRATPWRDLPAVQQAARGTGPRAKEAQALLAEIDDAGDDWGRVVQTSGKLNLFQDRVRAEKLYTKVEELAQPLGNMRLPKTTEAIDDAIARANDDVLPSPEVTREVIGALNRLKGEISPTESVRPSMGVRDPVTGTLRAEPVTPTTTVPDTSYSRMRRLRSSLGDLQREAAEPATARYLSGVKTALEEDMAAFTTQSNVPQLARAAKDADTFFRTRIVPYREGQLAKAIEKNLPDEIYTQFVRRGKDRAQYFYNGLDPKGQAAVRYGMVEEALEKAQSGAPDVFSPARFASALKKIQEAHGVFFKGTPQWEINGITKVMQHAQRAGQYAENPPTGQRGIAFGLLGGGAFASLPTVAQVLGTAQGLRTLLMTQRGRTFLLAASDMQPGSSALQRRLDAFLRTLPAGAGAVGAAVRSREEPAAR